MWIMSYKKYYNLKFNIYMGKLFLGGKRRSKKVLKNVVNTKEWKESFAKIIQGNI